MLIPLIAVLFVVGIQQAYAEEISVNVPFEPNYELDMPQCSLSYNHALNLTQFICGWFLEDVTPEELLKLNEEFPEVFHETDIDRAIEQLEPEIETSSRPQPVIKTEQQIEVEGIVTAREIVEAYGRGELDVDEFCHGGEIKENSIYYPDTDTIVEIKTPNDNVPFKTNLQFYYEHVMSEICKSEYTLANKINNAKRTLPGEGEKYVFEARTSFDDLFPNATKAYADKNQKQSYWIDFSKNNAEGFQCSIPGKQQGHCSKEIGDQPIPKPTISSEGKEALNKYWILRETGEAEIPFQEPDKKVTKTDLTRQYLESLGWTQEQIDAAMAVLEDENNEESSDP